jgi:hypothetical protein
MALGAPAPALPNRPVFGLPLAFDRPTAVVALRHPASATVRRVARELNALSLEIDRSGGRLVAVVGGDKIDVWDFVPRYQLRYPVFWDASGEVLDAWGAAPVDFAGLVRSLPGALAVRGRPHAHWRRGLSAAVVRDGKIHWRWRARSLIEPLPYLAMVSAITGPRGGGE